MSRKKSYCLFKKKKDWETAEPLQNLIKIPLSVSRIFPSSKKHMATKITRGKCCQNL
jgi:hypothetical protein